MTHVSLNGARGIELAAAPWRPYTIPGSTLPVLLTRLETDPGGGYTLAVRFPAGWQRPPAGRYAAAEEVLFLAGGFEMSDAFYDAGDAGYYPVGYPRWSSRSVSGALVLAWFSGPQHWSEGLDPDVADTVSDAVRRRWTEQASEPTTLGVSGRLLYAGPRRTIWMVDHLPDPIVVPPDLAAVDVFDLAGHRYWHTTCGQVIPAVPVGPAWVRTVAAYV